MKAFWRGTAEIATAVFSFVVVFVPVIIVFSLPVVEATIAGWVGKSWAEPMEFALITVITMATYVPIRLTLWKVVKSRWISGSG